MINLLSCLGKVVEKVTAEAIASHCESTHRKGRSAIDAGACLIQRIQEAWGHQQLVGALFLDVNGAFDHVNPARLVVRMAELGLDRDLIRWVQPFLTAEGFS
jgi:hypothetical protein